VLLGACGKLSVFWRIGSCATMGLATLVCSFAAIFLMGSSTRCSLKGDLVGKAKPVIWAPALAELHEIFLGQTGSALELVAGKHCRFQPSMFSVHYI
jgi:hypothetical protein